MSCDYGCGLDSLCVILQATKLVDFIDICEILVCLNAVFGDDQLFVGVIKILLHLS